MFENNKKLGALRSLALVGAMGACSAGVSQGALHMYVWDTGSNEMRIEVHGSLD